MVERRAPALGAIGPRNCSFKLGSERLKVDHRRQPLEIVALLRPPFAPRFNVEHPDLPHHPPPPISSRRSRAAPAPFAQALGGLRPVHNLLHHQPGVALDPDADRLGEPDPISTLGQRLPCSRQRVPRPTRPRSTVRRNSQPTLRPESLFNEINKLRITRLLSSLSRESETRNKLEVFFDQFNYSCWLCNRIRRDT